MRRFVPSCSVLVALCVFAGSAQALTRHRDDMCSEPKTKTDKWKSRPEVAGMTILIPPGFVASGGDNGAHYYVNGDHRSITIGEGRGMGLMRYSDVSEIGECETVIAGRRATITLYHWVVEDAHLSASGDAGAHFGAVARFYPTGSLRESYVQLVSNNQSDLKYFRELFWTVSFAGAPASPVATSATPATLAAATPAPASDAPAATPSAACAPAAATSAPLPAPNAVFDSSVVHMLLADVPPIPKGFEVLALQFSGTGELSGLSVAQSDLPDEAQHELSAVVASNLKPHDAHAPSTFLLRIDSGDTGLRYTVLPMPACAH